MVTPMHTTRERDYRGGDGRGSTQERGAVAAGAARAVGAGRPAVVEVERIVHAEIAQDRGKLLERRARARLLPQVGMRVER